MTLSRRDLLKTGAAAAVVAGVPVLRAVPAVAARSAVAPSVLTQAGFTAQVGTIFLVKVGAARMVPVRLDSVTSLPRPAPPAPASKGEGFSLIFSGPVGSPFVQGRYDLRHPTLGNLDLFLVPVGRAHKSLPYEAVINRLW